MSRVHSDQKFMNTARHKSDVTGPSKVVRIHQEGEDYHNASSLTSWLFMKYDMSYKTYSRKSLNRRIELREEYEADTGNTAPGNGQNALGYDHTEDPGWIEMHEILSDCGVPFDSDGTPLGFSDEIEIDKHNIKLCDALAFAKDGTLEDELARMFPELKEGKV